MSFFKNIKTENIELKLPFLKDDGFEIFIKREDLIHPIISGNKFRKLKYNIEKFKKNKNSTLITFGGAYSNHLLAVSYIAKIENINTIAFVRGDELGVLPLNSTLQRCFDNGMELIKLTCEHCFIPAAIEKWLKGEKAECPVCRYKFDSIEVENSTNTNINANNMTINDISNSSNSLIESLNRSYNANNNYN